MNKVDAINIMLQGIGEIPIDINDDQTLDEVLVNSFEGQLVAKTLDEVKKEVLIKGFRCNTSETWRFQPDITGYIPVPKVILRIESIESLIVKDWKLYDISKQSFHFDNTQKVKVIWDLPFDDLPYQIAYYITIRASRKFQSRVIGDPTAYSFTLEDENSALTEMTIIERKGKVYNMLDDGQSSRPIDRSTNPAPKGR